MTAQFTLAQLAQVDETSRRLDKVVDELVVDACTDRKANGRSHALVSIAYQLLRTRPPGNLASIAAAAVLALVDEVAAIDRRREPRPWQHDLLSGSGGPHAIPVPNGCLACGADRFRHGTRWHRIAELHQWMEPTNELRLARMRARREARQIARMRARKANPQSTSEDQCPTS